MPKTKTGSAGNRKKGRNLKWCELYSAKDTRKINKIKKVRRHINAHPGDIQAQNRMKSLTHRNAA